MGADMEMIMMMMMMMMIRDNNDDGDDAVVIGSGICDNVCGRSHEIIQDLVMFSQCLHDKISRNEARSKFADCFHLYK